MANRPWRITRISLEWGAAIASLIGLIQGAGSLNPGSVVALVIFGGTALTIAVIEHGWYRAPKPIGTPVRFLFFLALIWGPMSGIGYYAWPKEKPQIVKAVPLLAWKSPLPIVLGTPLTDTQLNATASVNGTRILGNFVYTPTFGSTLPGGTQTLHVKFIPADSSLYTEIEKAVTIVVNSPIHSVQNASPLEKKMDIFMQKYGLKSDEAKNLLCAEFPLGWDEFTVDLHGLRISSHVSWLPQSQVGNPHRTEFVWMETGEPTLVGDRISVGMPMIVSDQQTIVGNAVVLRREVGVSLEMDINPSDPGPLALMRGNTLISDIPGGRSPLPLTKNPRFSMIVRILSLNDDGIVMILGLRPYRG